MSGVLEAADTVARPRGGTARVRSIVIRTSIGLAVGAVLVLTFLRLVNASAVYERVAHLNIAVGLLCGATFLAAYVVRAVRWRYLLRPHRVSVRRAAAIYQIAIFLNWLLPIRGGELASNLVDLIMSGLSRSKD